MSFRKIIRSYLLFFNLLLLLAVILPSGCKKIERSSVLVVNNSEHDIEYYMALGGKGGIIYPDTILPLDLTPPFGLVKANNSSYLNFDFSEEVLFNEGLQNDTLSIFLFHPDTLSKYNWQTIMNEYNILKRYDLSYQDLKLLNWKVYYPPTNEMKGMKRYPNYP